MSTRDSLQDIFEAVPPHYDLINHIFTFGLDNKWREKIAKICLTFQPEMVLDLCCGTGELTIDLADLSKGKLTIIGLDYSKPMIDKAVGKTKLYSRSSKIDFVEGDASKLPFSDNSFDCVVIAFAFRNLTYRSKLALPHVTEVIRVLKKGGRYIIVESSQPGPRIIRFTYKLYLRYFVYWLGYLISGNKSAYNYLANSAANYFAPREINNMLTNAGFSSVLQIPLFLGATCIHIAQK